MNRAMALGLCLAGLFCSMRAAADRLWIDLRRHSPRVLYVEGGASNQLLKQRFRLGMVRCGGYSAWASPYKHRAVNCPRCGEEACRFRKLVGIDLVWIKGKTLVKYRVDLNRPVLVFTAHSARIDWPKRGAYWHPRKGDLYAMAGNSIAGMPDDGRCCLRQFLLVSQDGRKIAVVRAKLSTPQECYRIAAEYGVKDKRRMIGWDGSFQATDTYKTPAHFGVDGAIARN